MPSNKLSRLLGIRANETFCDCPMHVGSYIHKLRTPQCPYFYFFCTKCVRNKLIATGLIAYLSVKLYRVTDITYDIARVVPADIPEHGVPHNSVAYKRHFPFDGTEPTAHTGGRTL